MLETLRSDNLVLSRDNSCVVVSRVAVMEDSNLLRDQEEADANIICIVQIFFTGTMGRMYAYGSHLATAIIVNGSGSNKEHYKLSDFEIDIESTIAPLDLHATTCSRFSGNKTKNVGS